MNLSLIFPRIEHGVTTHSDRGSWGSIIFGYPEITLPHLAAMTPRDYSVEITNENYENIDYDKPVDLVGITSYTMTAPRVYNIADKFREKGVTVVLGGYHPSALPNEAIQHADSIVIGEAELSWPQLLNDFKKGKLKQFYKADKLIEADKILPLRRDLIKHNPIMGGIQSTRGCPHGCEFCAITNFFGGRTVRFRPIKHVINEMKNMPNRVFLFHDPSLTLNPSYTKALLKEMKKLNKGWVANGNTNVLGRDEELLKLAAEAGCIAWFVGFESVSQKSLNGVDKTCNKVEEFQQTVKKIQKYGMGVQGGIVFGLDHDEPDIFDLTLQALYDWGVDAAEINILTPFPGTPVFEKLEKEKRIFTKDWSKYDQVEVVFKPKNMTEKELFEGARHVAKEFYSPLELIKRIWGNIKMSRSLPSLFALPGINLSYRKYYRRDYAF
jgi:radical SAM superfamily enzyme YgiQ (UPF0313 family)